jgi:hypothetical protein
MSQPSACPALPSTYFQLADVFQEFESPSTPNIDHGLQFEDVNGDGLVDMLYGWDNSDHDAHPFICIYINTGHSWVLQNVSGHGALVMDCAASASLFIRDTEITFLKQTVGQFRQAVADEFSLSVDNVVVLSKSGFKQGKSTPLSRLFPAGFELSIFGEGDKALETYTCP